MHQLRSDFEPPKDENAIIWRYMDLAKLISLLSTKKLHFTRLDRFEDRFEGALPQWLVEMFQGEIAKKRKVDPAGGPLAFYREMRKQMFVNCWHLNEHESVAMWNQYVKSTEGVAIKSTYKRLKDAFESVKTVVFIGKVKYMDFKNPKTEKPKRYLPSVYSAVLRKRLSFSHERELRAVIHRERHVPAFGIDVSVNLTTLLDTIYVTPGAPQWFREVVESVVDRYGLGVPVIHSALDAEPLW